MKLMPSGRRTSEYVIMRLRWFFGNKYRTAAVISVFVCVLMFFAALFVTSIVRNGKEETRIKGVGFYEPFSEHIEYDMLGVSVTVKKSTHVMYLDGDIYANVDATVYPVKLQDTEVMYSSDDENIAEVDAWGTITAKNPGVAKITVSVENGRKKAKKLVTVRVIQPVDGIYLPKSSVTLYMGSTGQLLEYRVSPANASNQNVVWSSKNTDIATVDENGHVRPVSAGMTEIIASTRDGKFTAKCFVTVVNYSVNVESVTIENEHKENAYLRVGESMRVIASIFPSNAKNKTLKWESTNNNAATVSQTGKITALKEGTAQIRVTSINGKSDVINLTIQPSDSKDPFDLYDESSGYAVTNGDVTYTHYDINLSELVDIQMGLNPPPKYDGGRKLASRQQTAESMDPNSYYMGAYKYQFLDLSHSNGISEASLNSFLSDKGILRGHARDFIDAAKRYNVSEIYLVAHACLETGNGTSQLSTGVNVNGQIVYNMYGIGAYDDSAVYSGSKYAYNEGWTTVSSAIIGGAAWISKYYVNASGVRQNTLYKMLWNPQSPGQHQYATDIGWATQQAVNIERIFRMFPQAVKAYDVPVYNDTAAPVLDTSY